MHLIFNITDNCLCYLLNRATTVSVISCIRIQLSCTSTALREQANVSIIRGLRPSLHPLTALTQDPCSVPMVSLSRSLSWFNVGVNERREL